MELKHTGVKKQLLNHTLEVILSIANVVLVGTPVGAGPPLAGYFPVAMVSFTPAAFYHIVTTAITIRVVSI